MTVGFRWSVCLGLAMGFSFDIFLRLTIRLLRRCWVVLGLHRDLLVSTPTSITGDADDPQYILLQHGPPIVVYGLIHTELPVHAHSPVVDVQLGHLQANMASVELLWVVLGLRWGLGECQVVSWVWGWGTLSLLRLIASVLEKSL